MIKTSFRTLDASTTLTLVVTTDTDTDTDTDTQTQTDTDNQRRLRTHVTTIVFGEHKSRDGGQTDAGCCSPCTREGVSTTISPRHHKVNGQTWTPYVSPLGLFVQRSAWNESEED